MKLPSFQVIDEKTFMASGPLQKSNNSSKYDSFKILKRGPFLEISQEHKHEVSRHSIADRFEK